MHASHLEPPHLKPRLDLLDRAALDDNLLGGRADSDRRRRLEGVNVAVGEVLREVGAEGLRVSLGWESMTRDGE